MSHWGADVRMRVLTQLFIKCLMDGIVTVLVLPAVAAVSFGQAVVAAIVLTLLAYVIGDVGVLPRAGNAGAVVVDFILATLFFWALPLFMPVSVGLGPAMVAGGAVAVVEILYHVYLNSSRPRQAQ
jgi:hypothetical protein